METADAFLEAVSGERVDLARAALAIARDVRPDLDTARYLGVLDDLGARAAGIDDADVLARVDHELFVAQGFRGNTEDYYDPRNSYLDQVLDRRQGIPITLCVLYLEVAARAGVTLEPVGFPSHFLLAHRDGGRRGFIDPFHGGRRLGTADLEAQLAAMVGRERAAALLPHALAEVPGTEVVARMLRNLKLIHAQAQDWTRALAVSNRLVELQPVPGPELRDRAHVHEQLEAWRAAKADYETYLAANPAAEDAAEVALRLEALAARVRRLN